MSLLLNPDDERITWQDAISLQRGDGWVMPWRIPYERRSLFPPEHLHEAASSPSGVRIAFRSSTEFLAGSVLPDPNFSRLDLFSDGLLHGSIDLADRERFRFEDLPPGEKLLELWLPQRGRFRLRSLELSDGATVTPFDDDSPKWVTYGSSVTHCGDAESPSQTWPAIVARELGLNLTALGYGGNCHLEPMIARMIRDLTADYLSMKVGINIYSTGSLGIRTFRAAVIGFVQIVREKHPETPFAVASPIYSPRLEGKPNAVDFTLQAMRDEVAEAVHALRAHGDLNVHYVDGLTLLSAEDAHLVPDGVHPDADGYKLMGRRFLDKVANAIFMGRKITSAGAA